MHLTFKEAAAMCGCAEQSLRQAVKEGHLLSILGCDGPESDRIASADLHAYRARLKIERIARQGADPQ